jgi:hypothetical protein
MSLHRTYKGFEINAYFERSGKLFLPVVALSRHNVRDVEEIMLWPPSNGVATETEALKMAMEYGFRAVRSSTHLVIKDALGLQNDLGRCGGVPKWAASRGGTHTSRLRRNRLQLDFDFSVGSTREQAFAVLDFFLRPYRNTHVVERADYRSADLGQRYGKGSVGNSRERVLNAIGCRYTHRGQ